MKALPIALILTVAVAAWFWISWAHKMEVYRAETAAIKQTLSEQGLTMTRVFPLSRDPKCYTWNGLENDTRAVSGKICIGESDD